jgi:hypothetical protein
MLGTTNEGNVTMQPLLYVTQSIIATLLIYIAWGRDEPIYNFALVCGGLFLGHVITELLNYAEENE